MSLKFEPGVQGGAELPPAEDVVVGTFDLVSIQLYERESSLLTTYWSESSLSS